MQEAQKAALIRDLVSEEPTTKLVRGLRTRARAYALRYRGPMNTSCVPQYLRTCMRVSVYVCACACLCYYILWTIKVAST